MLDSKIEYKKREKAYHDHLTKLKEKSNLVSNARLIVMILGVGLSGYFYFKGDWVADILLFVTLVLFIALVIVHNRLKRDTIKSEMLLDINRTSLKRISGDWSHFNDSGAGFIDHDHPYTSDLDVFGPNSLFQWINTAVTYHGRYLLKKWLDTPGKDAKVIRSRQVAAKELGNLLDWRQLFQAEAIIQQNEYSDPKPLIRWAEKTARFYTNPAVMYIARIFPFITLSLFIAAYILQFTYLIPTTFIIIQMIFIGIRFLDMNQILEEIQPFTKSIKGYRGMLQLIETQEFKNIYLNQLKEKLKDKKSNFAYLQIAQLQRITDKLSIRHSQLYLIINILLLWDYRCLVALEKWKKDSGPFLCHWIHVAGELEALCSLAVIYCDHPDWALPQLHDDQRRLFASELGHPLLPEDRVCNDIGLMKEGQVYLVTGSNMSGKSTLLRTVGTNLVLAYAGAPVCAKEFYCSIFSIYTSMRIRDDLKSNISSFYAELLRIKKMIDAAKKEEPVFFLLDEIFRGTNSRDRHTGARVLIEQLSREGAVGFVSTHDVELGDLAIENNKIRNHHFREDYVEGQLHFDYKLRPGISNTRNAVFLMKMAGITVPDDTGR